MSAEPVPPLRILVVEDEVLIALELESLLQDEGHDVVGVAATSRDAIAMGEHHKPDLAFVDVHLADGPTGVEVARRLAGSGDTVVMFMTANAKRIPEDRAGARGIISKPYTERGVRQAIDLVRREIAERGGAPEPDTPHPARSAKSPENQAV